MYSRRRLLQSLGLGLFVLALVAGLAIWEGDAITEAFARVSWLVLALLAVLHLFSLILRAEAWRRCLREGDLSARPLPVHTATALTALAGSFLPIYIAGWIRLLLVRRWHRDELQRAGYMQMIAADGVLVVAQLPIIAVIVPLAAATLDLPLWVAPLLLLLGAALALLALWLRRRFHDHGFVRSLEVFANPRHLLLLFLTLGAGIVGQILRFYLVYRALGFDPNIIEAMVGFIAANVVGGLPTGPGPSVVGATTAVFGGALALATAAGVVLFATAALAALVYSLVGLAAMVLWQRKGPASRAAELRR